MRRRHVDIFPLLLLTLLMLPCALRYVAVTPYVEPLRQAAGLLPMMRDDDSRYEVLIIADIPRDGLPRYDDTLTRRHVARYVARFSLSYVTPLLRTYATTPDYEALRATLAILRHCFIAPLLRHWLTPLIAAMATVERRCHYAIRHCMPCRHAYYFIVTLRYTYAGLRHAMITLRRYA